MTRDTGIASTVKIRSEAASGRRWTIETTDGVAWQCSVAVIATGQYRQPIVPPGPPPKPGETIPPWGGA